MIYRFFYFSTASQLSSDITHIHRGCPDGNS
jgi:hypothetical protein